VFFGRLKAKKTHNVAVVATARRLVTIAWQLLSDNEPYRYTQPTAPKLSRLVRAVNDVVKQIRRSIPGQGVSGKVACCRR
jgi:hypothetical protein